MIGSGELIVILCLVMLLFGGKKLPEFARSLGEGIREFKKACNPDEDVKDNLPRQQASLEIEIKKEKTHPEDS